MDVAMKPNSAKCGHVKRRLNQRQPLTGKVLEFALGVIEEQRVRSKDDAFFDRLSKKLRSGDLLDEYEYHIMVAVLLPMKRLGPD